MKLLTCISILCITLLTYDWLIESLHECAHVPNNEWWTVSVCDSDYIQLITESGFLFSEIIQWWMESAISEAKSNFHFLTKDHGNVQYRLRRRRRTNHILFWKTVVRRTYLLHLYLFNDIYTTLHIIIYYLYGAGTVKKRCANWSWAFVIRYLHYKTINRMLLACYGCQFELLFFFLRNNSSQATIVPIN